MIRIRSVLIAILLTAVVSAQTTIIVQGGGMAFGTAEMAAQPGDLLLVRAGIYLPHTTTKGITVVCDPGVSFFVMKFNPFGVRGVPAGQQFTMHGGDIVNFEGERNIVVENCIGSVVFESVVTDARNSEVVNSRRVAFHACDFPRGLDVIDSTVSLASCSIRGSIAGNRSPSLRAVRSNTVLVDSSVVRPGGPGIPSWPAIEFDGGTLTITGDASTIIEASAGTGVPAPAVGTSTGSVWIDPAVTLVSQASQKVGGGASVVMRRIPWTRAPTAKAGKTFRAVTTAAAGSYVVLFVSWPVPPSPLTPFGQLWVSPLSSVWDMGTVPASGSRVASLTLPPIPVAVPVVLQALQLTSQGSLAFGAPTFVVLN